MRALALILALPLLLAACRQPSGPVTPASGDGVKFGTLFDGTSLAVNRDGLQGKALVINFFGVG
jgi:hypothetical protein